MFFIKNFIVIFCISILYSTPSYSIKVKSDYAFLIDFDSDQVLFEKNPDKKIFPASMSKLMTLYVLFDYLEKGLVSMSDEFFISENAWRKGGAVSDSSTMFAEVSSYISIENLIRGIVIHSGNDACIAVAEGISGSEELFATEMNFLSQEIGMTKSNFVNSTGLHNEAHYSTAKDLVILAKSLINNFPQYYHFFSEQNFIWNGIFQPNRNNLLTDDIGVDGLKTGRTNESGYSMIVSSLSGGNRLIGVLGGLSSKETRTSEMKKLINYGQKRFKRFTVFKAQDLIGEAKVWGGKYSKVNLTIAEDINIFLDIRERRLLNAKYSFYEPIIAPVKKGQYIGKILILNDDIIVVESDLISQQEIKRKSIIGRTLESIRYLID